MADRLGTFRGVCASLAALAVILVGFAGCAHEEGAGDDRQLIVCTTGMIADITEQIVGDRIRVEALMGPGVDPHLYKPTSQDMAMLFKADMVLYNGLLLEGKMTASFEKLQDAGRPVYAVTELIDPASLLTPPEFAGHHDPHVWMDPIAWSRAVELVRDRVIELDPDGAELYRSRTNAYLEQLADLDAYARRVLAGVPESQRVLVTAHDAFNYFARRYGYEVEGVQGISTESEAGVRDIERLVDLIVDRSIPAVFSESTISNRNIDALIAGARARGWTVVRGGMLYSDAMGRPDTYTGTYLGMIDHNVTTIARALGGEDVPAGGWSGRLTSEDGP